MKNISYFNVCEARGITQFVSESREFTHHKVYKNKINSYHDIDFE